jgi:ribonuclease P protein component
VGNDVFTILGHNNRKSIARLGLAIARKHIKNAVGRNRIKRLVRESFREHQSLLAGIDIVVTIRTDASRLDNETIRKNLKKHWQKLKEKCEQY